MIGYCCVFRLKVEMIVVNRIRRWFSLMKVLYVCMIGYFEILEWFDIEFLILRFGKL